MCRGGNSTSYSCGDSVLMNCLLYRRCVPVRFVRLAIPNTLYVTPSPWCRRLLTLPGAMADFERCRRLFLHRSPSPPRHPPNSEFRVLDTAQKVEEERFVWYEPAQFYPVCIGEIFNSRYQVVGKLGYGPIPPCGFVGT